MEPPPASATTPVPASAPAPAPTPTRWRWLPVLLCALAGVAVFAFFGNATRGYIDTRSLFWWWAAQWFNPASDTQHGPLVLLVSAWLFWRNLRATQTVASIGAQNNAPASWSAALLCRFGFNNPKRQKTAALQDAAAPSAPVLTPVPVPALAAMLAALALHLLGYTMQQTRLSILALLLFAWGVLALPPGGRRWARAAMFPLGFLLLAIPLGFLDTPGFYLRLGVTNATSALMRAAGVAVVSNGTQLLSPGGHYQYDIAAACSGIRSLVALLALALLVAYLRLKTFSRRALLVALAVPFVFLGNVLRIALIVLAGEKFGHAAGVHVHDWSGWLVFAIVFLPLLAAAKLIHAGEPPPKKSTNNALTPFRKGVRVLFVDFSPAAAALVLLAAALTAYATTRIDALTTTAQTAIRLAPDGINPAPLPEFLNTNGATWNSFPVAMTDIERNILPPDTGYACRTYVNPANRVSGQAIFSIVLSGRDRTSIHRPETCILGQGYTITSRSVETLTLADGEKLAVTILHAEIEIPAFDGPAPPSRIPVLFAYWFAASDTTVPTYSQILLRNATDRLLRLRADRWAYFIVETFALSDEAANRARLLSIINALWPQIRSPNPPRQQLTPVKN